MRRIIVTPSGSDSINFPEKELAELIQEAEGTLDIEMGFPDLLNPLIIPSIIHGYEMQLRINPKINFSIFPVISEEKCKNFSTISVTPFPINQKNKVVVGGTFDHMHSGHKVLLTTCALIAKFSVLVGVTRSTPNKQFADLIEPFSKRCANVTEFLMKTNQYIRVSTVAIDNATGPAGTDADLEVCVLSQETIKGGQMVQDERIKNQIPPVEIVAIPLIQRTETEKLSSTFIRSQLEAEK